MKILELIETLGKGGAERMVSHLSLALSAKGHSVTIVSLRELECMPIPAGNFEEAGVDIIELGKTDGFSPSTIRRLIRLVKEGRCDVVHTHNPFVNHYGALAARLGSAPILVNTVHGISTLQMPWKAATLYRASCALTHQVVSVCKAADVELYRRMGIAPAKRSVIYNGIEVRDFQSIRPRRSGEEVVFGAIGRMVPVKDHRSLLEAFSIARTRHPRCRLEIVGNGELEGQLREQARTLGIDNSVRFNGSDTDIVEFLGEVDVFVLSSISEGLPLVVLEAMAAGRPIVATAVGGVPELIQESGCGWLCEPSNSQKLAETLIRAMESTDREKKGALGRQHAAERYTAEVMAAQYGSLFTRLLGNPSATVGPAQADATATTHGMPRRQPNVP